MKTEKGEVVREECREENGGEREREGVGGKGREHMKGEAGTKEGLDVKTVEPSLITIPPPPPPFLHFFLSFTIFYSSSSPHLSSL